LNFNTADWGLKGKTFFVFVTSVVHREGTGERPLSREEQRWSRFAVGGGDAFDV